MSGVWLFVLAVVAACSAQELPAGCPQKTVIKDFNTTAYMGRWYEYAKFGYTPYEEGGVCVTADYSLAGEGNVTVVNSQLDNRTREHFNSTAWAGFSDDSGDARLAVHFPSMSEGGMYWVLSTDYENYSLVWACTQMPQSQNVTETSWILIRSRSLSNETRSKVNMALEKADIPLQRYTMTEQGEEVCGAAGRLLGTSLALLVAALLLLR